MSLRGKVHRKHLKEKLKSLLWRRCLSPEYCQWNQEICHKHYDTYCKREMIERAFPKLVCSVNDIVKMTDNLTKSIANLLCSDIRASDIEITILREKDRLINKKLVVDTEIPHTKWLQEYLSSTLDKSLVIKSREENFKYMGLDLTGSELTEYAASEANLVIHSNKPMTSNSCVCMIGKKRE